MVSLIRTSVCANRPQTWMEKPTSKFERLWSGLGITLMKRMLPSLKVAISLISVLWLCRQLFGNFVVLLYQELETQTYGFLKNSPEPSFSYSPYYCNVSFWLFYTCCNFRRMLGILCHLLLLVNPWIAKIWWHRYDWVRASKQFTLYFCWKLGLWEANNSNHSKSDSPSGMSINISFKLPIWPVNFLSALCQVMKVLAFMYACELTSYLGLVRVAAWGTQTQLLGLWFLLAMKQRLSPLLRGSHVSQSSENFTFSSCPVYSAISCCMLMSTLPLVPSGHGSFSWILWSPCQIGTFECWIRWIGHSQGNFEGLLEKACNFQNLRFQHIEEQWCSLRNSRASLRKAYVLHFRIVSSQNTLREVESF